MKTMKRLLALLLALCMVMPNCLTIASAYSEELTEELVEEIPETPEEVVEEIFEEEEIIEEEVEEYQASDDLAGETSQDVTVTCEEYHYVPDLELPSDEELFRGYVDSVLKPEQSVSLLSTMGRDSLTYGGNAFNAYCALHDTLTSNYPSGPLVDIAEGRRAETVITVGEVEAEEHAWLEGGFSDVDLKLLLDALLTDLPFHLYWFDKTQGVRILVWTYTNSDGSKAYNVEFYFTVSHDYADQSSVTLYNNSIEMYCTTDLAKTGAAYDVSQYAWDVAASAMAEDSEYSYDYQILQDYFDWLQDPENVEYNYEAAADDSYYSTVDTDPWQLIYVFDQDPDTKVVCEGYAKAFEYLCDLGSLSSSSTICYSVAGDLYQDGELLGGHMWNLVELDGGTYLVDATNGVFLKCAKTVETVTRTDIHGTAEVLYQTVYDDIDGCELGYEYDVETTELFGSQRLQLSTKPYDPIIYPEPDPDIPQETEPEPDPEPDPEPEEPTYTVYDADTLQEALNNSAAYGEIVELHNDLELSGVVLTIPAGVTLQVADGVTLTNSGAQINVEGCLDIQGWLDNTSGIFMASDEASLTVTGTVDNAGQISTEGTGAMLDFSMGTYNANGGSLLATYDMEGNVSGVSNADVTLCCYTAGDVSTIEALQERVESEGYAGASISISADLEIAGDTELVIETTTTLVVKYDCTLTNNGKITNNGNFYLSMRGSSGQGATLINNGTVANYGTFIATEYSYVTNNGTVENNDGATLDRIGTWEGNDPVVPESYTMTQDEFEAALEQNPSYTMGGGSVLIERDLVIDNWLSLFSDAKIVVGPGVTLTLNETSNIQGGALVLKGGTLVLNSTLSLGRYPGYTTVFDVANGTLSFGSNGYIELSGADGVNITGDIPKANFVRYEYASTAEQLLAALEVDNSPYRKYSITVSGNEISLPAGTEIPAGTTVNIEMGGTLTFEGDAVNNGDIGVYEDSFLTIAEGYVLTNNGTIRDMGGTITGEIREGTASDDSAEQELQEQLNGSDSWIQLEENVTITGTVTIPSGKVLFIGEGVTLTVAEGGELVNNGNIQTDNGILNVAGTLTNNRLVILQTFGNGELNVTGTLVNNSGISVIGGKAVCTGTYTGNGMVTWDIHAELTGIPASIVQSIVYPEEELHGTLSQMAEMEGNFYMRKVLTDADIELTQDLTVPAGVTLQIGYSWATNEPFPQYGLTIPAGITVTNNGTINVLECAYLYNNGTIVNNGTITGSGTYESTGTVNGNRVEITGGVTGEMTQAEFEAALAEAEAAKTGYALNGKVTLEEDMTIKISSPNGFTVSTLGELIVPDGVTLTVNGYTYMRGGKITVQGGGKVVFNADVDHGSGTLTAEENGTVEGTIRYYPGNSGCYINGIPNSQLYAMFFANSEAELLAAIDNEAGYGYVDIIPASEFTLTQSVTIPEGMALSVSMGGMNGGVNLTVGQDLTVNGKLYVSNANVLNIEPGVTLTIGTNGYVGNYGAIYCEGSFINNGYVQNNGIVWFPEEGTPAGTGTWDGNNPTFGGEKPDLPDNPYPPVIEEITTQDALEEKLNEAKENLADFDFYGNVTLERDLEMGYSDWDQNIDCNVYVYGDLTVPAGKALTINGGVYIVGGSINVEYDGKLVLGNYGYLELVEGTLDVSTNATLEKPTDKLINVHPENNITISGIPYYQQYAQIHVSSWEELAAAEKNENGYGRLLINPTADITLADRLALSTQVEIGLIDTTLVIPAGQTMMINASVNVARNAKILVEPEGNLYTTETGWMSIFGNLENNGSVYNFGTTEVYDNGTITGNGFWSGNEPVYNTDPEPSGLVISSQTELNALLAGAEGDTFLASQNIIITGQVSLTKSMVLDGASLTIENGGALTVPEGKELGSQNYGVILVKDGGKLENNGSMMIQASELTVQNASTGYVQGENAQLNKAYSYGNLATINGIPNDQISFSAMVANVEQIAEVNAHLENAGYKEAGIVIEAPLDVTRPESEPEGPPYEVHVTPNAQWYVNNDITVDESAFLIVDEGAVLNLNGHKITVDGQLFNYGGIDMGGGNITVTPGDYHCLTNAGNLEAGGATLIIQGTFYSNTPLFLIDGAVLSVDGILENYAPIHVGFPTENDKEDGGQLNVSGTMNNYGYLNVCDGAEVNVSGVLNNYHNEQAQADGFIENHGLINVSGSMNIEAVGMNQSGTLLITGNVNVRSDLDNNGRTVLQSNENGGGRMNVLGGGRLDLVDGGQFHVEANGWLINGQLDEYGNYMEGTNGDVRVRMGTVYIMRNGRDWGPHDGPFTWEDGTGDGSTEDYLAYLWLNNGPDGWYVNTQSHFNREGIRIWPGYNQPVVFYENRWIADGENYYWERNPVVPEIDCDNLSLGHLTNNPGNTFVEGSPVDAMVEVRTENGMNALDTAGEFRCGNLSLPVYIGRDLVHGFYSAPEATNENWLEHIVVNNLAENPEDLVIYHIVTDDRWELTGEFALDSNLEGVDGEYLGNNIFEITIPGTSIKNIQRGAFLDIRCFNVEGGDYGYRTNIQSVLNDPSADEAWMFIDGVSVQYSAEYDLWVAYGMNGPQYWDMAAKGLHYDYATNTLTMENANLTNLEFGYYDWDGQNPIYDWLNLPNENLKLNLIGENTIVNNAGSALRVSRGVKLNITGDGSLYLKTDNGEGVWDEWEQRWIAWPALDVCLPESELTISGNANVTAEIAGKAYDTAPGVTEPSPGHASAIAGWERSLTVTENASLTTVVPGNALHGNELPGAEFHGGYSGIDGFHSITVSGNAQINTQDLDIHNGTYTQTGGYVTIEPLGYVAPHEMNNSVAHTHMDGIRVGQNSTVTVTGGTLDIRIPDTSTESTWYRGIGLNGGTLNIGGDARIEVWTNGSGNVINLENAWDENGNPIEGGSTLNMTGGTLVLNGGIWQENDVVTGEPHMTRPVAIWTNDQSVANFENGRINAYNVIFEFNGTTTWGTGDEESWPVLHGEKVYFGAGGPDFKVNSGCIELIGGYNQVGGEEQFFYGVFDTYGNVNINGGSIFLRDGVFGVGTATALNGGEIDITNDVTDTEGLYVGNYFAINGGSLKVTTPGGTNYNREGELITVPAVWVDGTFHQMGGKVNINGGSEEAIHNYGSVMVNGGTMTLNGKTAMISEYSENGWFFVNQADPDRDTVVFLQGQDFGLISYSGVEIMGGKVYVTAYGEANEETGFAPAAIMLEAVYDEEGNLIMVPDSTEDPMVHLAVVGGYLYASAGNGTAISANNAPIIIHNGEDGAKSEVVLHGDMALRTYSPDENTGVRTDYPFENMNGDVLSMDQELHEESGWYINTLMDGENIATDARAAYRLTQEDLAAEIAKAKAEGTVYVLTENFELTDDLVIDCQFKINPNVRLTVPEGMTLTVTDEVTEDASFDIYGMLEVQGTLDVNGYLYNAGQIDNYGLVTGNGTIFNGTTFHTTHGSLEFNGFWDGYPPIDEGNFDDIATDVWMHVNGMDVEYAAAEDLWLTWGENGREVVKLPEGLSYNYNTNTLTLDNASLSGLEVGYYGWDDEANAPALDENGDYAWTDLPNENLTINLVGASTINSTELKDHALKIYRGVKLDITGDGSLYVVTDNGEGFYGEDETGHWWWSCAPVNLGGDDCGLTLSGKAKVTVQVSGKGAYSDENGDKRVGYLGAIQGGGSSLTINDQAALTTILPENVLRYDNINGTGDYEAINGFDSITVNGGTLNTQFIGVGQTFTQNGGTVNITAQPALMWEDKYEWNDETQEEEYIATVQHTHFDGIHTNGGTVSINGGALNITIPETATTESVYYRGIAMDSGMLDITGGTITIDGPANIYGNGIALSCAYGDNGPVEGTFTTMNMSDGTLVMKEAIFPGPDYGMTDVIWGDGNAVVNITGGTMDLDAVSLRLNGKTTWNGGVVNGEELIFQAGGPEFVINDGTFNLTGKPIEGDNEIFSNALFRASGNVTMNGGTINIIDGVLGVPTAFELAGGEITITNDEQFADCWGLILPTTENGAGYMSIKGGTLTVNVPGGVYTYEDGYTEEVYPAVMIHGTLHQMGGTVNISSRSTAAIKSFGSVMLNGGEMNLTGCHGIGQFYNEENPDGQFFVNGGKLTIEATDTGIFAYNSPVVIRQGENGVNPSVAINAAAAAIQLLTDGEESGFVSDYSLVNQEGKRLVLETRDRRDEEAVGCFVHTLMEDGAYAKYAQLHQVPIMTQDEFLAAMRAAAASDNKAVVVNGPVIIESDLTLESTVIVRDGGSLTVMGGTLTIPNQWDLAAEHDGVILADGGYIRNEGMLAANGGSIHIRTENGYEHIQIEGAARQTEMHNWYYPGTGVSDVSGIDLQFQSLRANLDTADQLQSVNAVENLSAYGSVVVELLSSMTLDMFYTIPANVSVNMGGGRMLTIAENVTLTVEGSLFVHDGAVLMTYGTVNNNGSLHIGIWQDGSHDFSGTMVVEASGVANLRGYTCIHGLQTVDGEMPDYYPGNMQVYGTVNTYAELPEGSNGTGTGGYIQNGGILNVHNGGVINSGFLFSADGETNVFAGGTLNHSHDMFVTGMLNVAGQLNNTGRIFVENENHDAMIHVDGKLVNDGQMDIADCVVVGGELENNAGIFMTTDTASFTTEGGTVTNNVCISTEATKATIDFTNGTYVHGSKAFDEVLYAAELDSDYFADGTTSNVKVNDMSKVTLRYAGDDFNAAKAMMAKAKADGYGNYILAVMGEMEMQIGVDETLIIEKGSYLTIKPGSSLTVNGTLINQGTIYVPATDEASASLTNYGHIVNEGTFQTASGSYLNNWGTLENGIGCTMSLNGTYEHNGRVLVIMDEHSRTGTITGNITDDQKTLWAAISDSVEDPEGFLRTLINASHGYRDAEITLLTDVTITEDLQIPEKICLYIGSENNSKSGSLTLAEGVELLNNGLLRIHTGDLTISGRFIVANTLEVHKGTVTINGALVNGNYMTFWSNATLVNNGTIDNGNLSLNFESGATYIHGENAQLMTAYIDFGDLINENKIEGIDAGYQTLFHPVRANFADHNEDTIRDMMAAVAAGGYAGGAVWIFDKNVSITGDMTVPENVTIRLGMNMNPVELTVENGAELTIDGTMTIEAGEHSFFNNGTVIVDGEVINDGCFTNACQLDIYGKMTSNGNAYNEVTTHVYTGGILDINGSWEGYAPINMGGTITGGDIALTQDKLEEALAEAKAGGYAFVLTENFTLERNLTIDADFRVDDGISLTVPKDITITVNTGDKLEINGILNNNGTIETEGALVINGTGNNNGTVNVWQDASVSGNGAWNGNEPVNMGGGTISGSAFAITEAEFLAGVAKAEAEGTEYVLSMPVTLTHDLTIGGRFTIATSGKLTVAKNAVLNVSQTAVFVNYGILDVVGTANVDSVYSGEQTDPTTTWYGFTNNGQIDVRGKMTINGEMDNAMGHNGWFNGTTIHVWNGGHLHADGVWTGYAPMVDEGGKVTGTATFYTELRLMNAMNGFAAQGIPMVLRIPYTMIFDMDIAGDVTIAEGVTFTIPEGMTLTIPEGATLTVKGNLVNNGSLIVEGTLNADGYVTNNGSTTVTGTLTANGSWGGNRPSGTGTIVGTAFELNQDNLEQWLKEIENTEQYYGLTQNFTLERDMTVSATLFVESGVLVIPEGMTLTVEAGGTVLVNTNGKLINNGTIIAKGGLGVNGQLTNNGKVDVSGRLNLNDVSYANTYSEYINNGTTTILSGGVLNMNGIWTGNLPVNEGGTVNGMLLTQADLEKAMAEVDSYTLETSFELTEDLFIDNELVIPEGVTLTVPTGISVWVNGNLVNHGTILVDGALRVINTMTNGETGTLEFHGSGIITGIVENYGTANVYTGAVLSGRGDWNVNDPVNLGGTITGKAFELHHEEFLELMANGETLNEIFTLEKSMTIDSMLTIGENGKLVIPAGMTLTIANGNMVTVNGGSIVAETGARIRNYGVLENKLGIIDVQSSNGYTGTGGVTNHFVDGAMGTINGIPAANQMIMAQCSNMDFLQNLKGLLGSDIGEYVEIQVELTGSGAMTYNMTIDENMLVVVMDDNVLNVANNVILTVNGRLGVMDSRLIVNGTMNINGEGRLITWNGGDIFVNGVMNNNAECELGYAGETSSLVNYGTVKNTGSMIIGGSCAVENNNTLNNSGEILLVGTITDNGTIVNNGTISGDCGSKLNWNLSGNKLEITGQKAMTDSRWNMLTSLMSDITEVSMPRKLTSISDNAFKLLTNVESFTVPHFAIDFGENAFPAGATLKAEHESFIEDYVLENPDMGYVIEWIHEIRGDGKCEFCDYTLHDAIEDADSAEEMVDAFKNVDTEALKDQIQQELEIGEANISALVQMVEKEITAGNEDFIDAAVDAAKEAIKDTFEGKITSDNVVGAALSALEGVDKVTLVISDPKAEPEMGTDVAADTSLVFNMTLEGVEDAKNLNAPVTIRLPIPANATYDGDKVVIWHFRDGVAEEYEKILAMVEDGMAVFAVSSFSHFAFPAEANIYVGETGFATMKAAVAAAVESGEIITVKNVPEDAAYEIPAEVTVQVLSGVSYEVKAAAGLQTVKNADGTVSVEREPVAKIGETGYPTLEAAILAATEENNVIDLVKSIEAEVIVDKAVVINRNGNTAVIKADLGYILDDKDETCYKIKLATAVIGETSYATLKEALAAAEALENPVITLQAVPEDGIVIEQAVSIKAPNIKYTIVCGKGWEAIEEVGGIVRIQKDPNAQPVAQVGDVTFTSLEEAIAAADGEIIDLLADIGSVTISQTATINTNGWNAEITAGEGFKTKLDGSVFYVYEENLFLFAGANILAGDSLDMYFWIKKADLAGSTDYYAIVRRTYGDGREDVVKRIPYSEWEDKTSMMRICFPGLAAKEMTDEIYITIYRGDNVQVSHQRVDSIKMYTMRNLEDPTTESKLCTVLVDMLNYGAAAQVYFDGYSVDDLATDGIDEYQKYATEEIRYEDRREKGPNYIGSTVSSESELILTFYFQKITKDMTAYITYTNSYNTEKTIVIPGSEFHNYTSTILGARVHGLAVSDGRQLVKCEIKDAEGKVVASAVDSIESYIARSIEDDVIFGLMLKFIDSAYDYFR